MPPRIRELPLSIFISFEEVVARKSFSEAAQHLNLHPSTVSRHVDDLEKAVGMALVRRTRPAALTVAGQVLHQTARRIVAQARRLAALVEPPP